MNVFATPLLDHAGLDLEGAHRITYRIEQSFRYTYDTPVTSVAQRLIVVPPNQHGDQHLRDHAITVTGAQARRTTHHDADGNTVVFVNAPRVDHVVEFRVDAVIERIRDSIHPTFAESMLRDWRLRQPTRLTAADDHLRRMAGDLMAPGGTLLELAGRISTAVQAAISYRWGITTVETTAAEALAGGVGVCQDSAHVMVALCHIAGVPARYVSGHLLGQGGTHAWVEVVVHEAGEALVVAFDPCNGRRADSRYVTVAVGRDYADVAPTSGSFVGEPGGELTTSRLVGVVAIEP